MTTEEIIFGLFDWIELDTISDERKGLLDKAAILIEQQAKELESLKNEEKILNSNIQQLDRLADKQAKEIEALELGIRECEGDGGCRATKFVKEWKDRDRDMYDDFKDALAEIESLKTRLIAISKLEECVENQELKQENKELREALENQERLIKECEGDGGCRAAKTLSRAKAEASP